MRKPCKGFKPLQGYITIFIAWGAKHSNGYRDAGFNNKSIMP